MPNEEADGQVRCSEIPSFFKLASNPDMIARHAVFRREGFPFPDLASIKKGTGLNRHLVIGVDGAGDGDLVEQI